jgi:hypothetical protein
MSMETIRTRIWQEEAEPDNAFAALSCHCHGYDVYGDLLRQASWIEYLFFLWTNRLRPAAPDLHWRRALGAEAHAIRSSEDLINLDTAAMRAAKCPTYVNNLFGFDSSGSG